MPEGSTEKPNYPRESDGLFAFCIDGLTDINDMIRRLNHADRDTNVPKPVVNQVRLALWNQAREMSSGGTIGRPPGFTGGGSSWIGRRRSI